MSNMSLRCRVLLLLIVSVVLFSATGNNLQAQELPSLELPKFWSRTAITAPLREKRICYGGKRLFGTSPVADVIRESVRGAGFLLLYNVETNELIRSFGKCWFLNVNGDSTATIITDSTLHLVRLQDGTDINIMKLGLVTCVASLSDQGDTLGIGSLDTLSIVDCRSGAVLGSTVIELGDSEAYIKNIQRIPETDTILVGNYFHQSGKYFRFVGAVHAFHMRDLQSRNKSSFYFKTLFGKRLVRDFWDNRVYDRFNGRDLTHNASTVIAVETGEYILVYAYPLSVTVLSSDLQLLWSKKLNDTSSRDFVAWQRSGSEVSIALDSTVWEIDVKTGTVTTRIGIPLPADRPGGSVLTSPIHAAFDSASGLWFYDFEKSTRMQPFGMDGRPLYELRPIGQNSRVATGSSILEIDPNGKLVQRTEWNHDPSLYSYEADAWFSIDKRNRIHTRKSFDSVTTPFGAEHSGEIIGLWLSHDELSYFTADDAGLILEWNIATQAHLRAIDNLVRASSKFCAMYKVPGALSFNALERNPDGTLNFVRLSDSGVVRRVSLGPDTVATIDTNELGRSRIVGPTSDGKYFVSHPRSNFIYAIDKDDNVTTAPAWGVRSLAFADSANKLFVAAGDVVEYRDPQNLSVMDTASPYPGNNLSVIELTSVGNELYVVAGTKVMIFNTNTRRTQHLGYTSSWPMLARDGSTMVQIRDAFDPDLNQMFVTNILSGDPIMNDRFSDWLSPEGYSKSAIVDHKPVFMQMSDSEGTFVMLLQGYKSPHGPSTIVACQSPSASSIRYGVNPSGLSMFENGKYFSVNGVDRSSIFPSSSYTPVATGLGTCGALSTASWGAAAAFNKFVKYTRPLGSTDAWGGIVQVGDSSLKLPLLPASQDVHSTYRYKLDAKASQAIGALYDGVRLIGLDSRIRDTVNLGDALWSFDISADGRLLALHSWETLILYDVFSNKVIGRCNQFSTIEKVKWSNAGHKLFVCHDDAYFGLYDCENIPLSVSSEVESELDCGFVLSVEDRALHIRSKAPSASPFQIRIFSVSGDLLQSSTVASGPVALTPSSQMLFVNIRQDSSECTYAVPYLR